MSMENPWPKAEAENQFDEHKAQVRQEKERLRHIEDDLRSYSSNFYNESSPNFQYGQKQNWERAIQEKADAVRNLDHGVKFDTAKITPQYIAPEMITALSSVLAYGAWKYSPRNWEKGMAWSRPFGGMMRHMWAWWKGENLDPETGFSHLWHAACCLMFLIAYEERKVGQDDRT